MILDSNNVLGNLTHQQFLDEYWQQKPLLIRQAFTAIIPPFTVEELAGLCCDSEEAGRLILEKGNKPWQVIHSPLEEQHFLDLPDNHWTLLVNDLERYYPEHRKLLDYFRFIPDWRIDDLMISYAADGGSVGPHVDQYDVFLIQASGKRHWMLDTKADQNHQIPNVELALLADFNTQQEWTLEAGDMLYLPPNLAHYGVAQGDNCMTYSVGFRAPSQQELVESWLAMLSDKQKMTARYQDVGRLAQQQRGKIEPDDIKALKAHLHRAIEDNDELFTEWLGRYLTDPKVIDSDEYQPTDEDIESDLDDGMTYLRNTSIRLAWIEHTDHISLFINGEASKWPIDAKEVIEYICSDYQYSKESFNAHQQSKQGKELIQLLLDDALIVSYSSLN